jgi:hypothetical protein
MAIGYAGFFFEVWKEVMLVRQAEVSNVERISTLMYQLGYQQDERRYLKLF